jgi:hypothetical protein
MEQGVRMAKAHCCCPECKKMLTQVLSSFECLSTWSKAEDYYEPGNEGKLVNRCSVCETLTKEEERKIHRELKKKTGEENVRSPRFKKKLKEIRHAV